MDCQTQKAGYPDGMTSDVHARSRLTPKGQRTRARIIDAAARLIYERGVAGTTLEDVRAAADVSGSQLYHYFADKEDLVQAVISRQADDIVANHEQADLATTEGLRAWRDMVIAAARSGDARGGCPLGSLGSQLAETDPDARALIAAGFGRWSAAIAAGLRTLHAAGPQPAGIDADDLAVTLLATLQGGLLLAQVQRDTRPLETAIDTILALASASQSAADADPASAVAGLAIGNPGHLATQAICHGAENGVGGLQRDTAV
jgi:AcrR family transcriptional regulator